MNSKVSVIRELLSVLLPKFDRSKKALSAQAVSMIFYSLKSMSSDEPEVRDLLWIMTHKLLACTESLLAQHVGNILYGFQGKLMDYCCCVSW
jgi:hypothetical protein